MSRTYNGYRYVAITLFFVVTYSDGAPSPLRLTIDCGFDERASSYRNLGIRPKNRNSRFDVETFCNLIHNAIPKAVKDGKFILLESNGDQDVFADTQVPVSLAPPEGFIPPLSKTRFKVPKLRIPKINVPILRPSGNSPSKAPRLGSTMSLTTTRSSMEDESSAEKMEKFKKGVQKMLHVVRVLGQIDQYLSERTRIVIDKLAKTFGD